MKFSVLISVYNKESCHFFNMALKSIWDDQILKPNEIVIVKDGPLSTELENIIEIYSQIAPINVITFNKNMGLGIALAKGIEVCKFNIIARMDSDDIAYPDRFEKQIKFITNHPEYDVIGSNIAEFNQSINDIVSYRKLPEKPNEIALFAKRRNPMNHMSVVFRKEAVLRAGNYIPFQGYEDYYLWIRMLLKGSTFYNLQEILILARIGNEMIIRRQGKIFFFQELKLQKELLRIRFINWFDYIFNLFFRAIPRLFPVWGLKYVYNYLRK